jgi:hypothetical protein
METKTATLQEIEDKISFLELHIRAGNSFVLDYLAKIREMARSLDRNTPVTVNNNLSTGNIIVLQCDGEMQRCFANIERLLIGQNPA